MGTDDLFHKKRIRREKELDRKRKFRSSHDLSLIICEGTKTEPNYFKGVRTGLRLNRESIVIHEKCRGNDPLNLVKSAEEEFIKERKRDPEKQGYDHVFVVFDKDIHKSFNDALQKIQALNKKYNDKFKAIISVPCFEFWFLLHFEDTAKPYVAVGSNSAGDQVIHDLKKYIPDYEKGQVDVFGKTYPFVEEAIRRAFRLEKRQEENGTDNPSTKVHYLVEYLRNLKKGRD